MVTSIVLPNNKQYTFHYGSNGYLDKLTFPTGAYLKYLYYVPQSPGWHVQYRKIAHDGQQGSEQTTTYAYSYSGGAISQTTVTDPLGSVVAQDYDSNGRNIHTSYKNSSNVTLRQIFRAWSGSNPAVSEEDTIEGSIMKMSTYSYDSYNNLLRQDDYDWQWSIHGPLIRYKIMTFPQRRRREDWRPSRGRPASLKVTTARATVEGQPFYKASFRSWGQGGERVGNGFGQNGAYRIGFVIKSVVHIEPCPPHLSAGRDAPRIFPGSGICPCPVFSFSIWVSILLACIVPSSLSLPKENGWPLATRFA